MKNTHSSNRINTHFKINMKLTAIIVIFMAIFLFLFALPMMDISSEKQVADASGLEDKLDQNFVTFYETKIAGEPVISALDKDTISRLQAKHNLTEKRTLMLVVFEDFGKRVGNIKTFDELTKMSDKQLLLYGKSLVDAFSENLSDDEKDSLKLEFLSLMKGK